METARNRTKAPRWYRWALRRWVPYTLLLAGCLLSAAASFYVWSTEQIRLRTQFVSDAARARYQIRAALETQFDVVRTGAALLSARTEMNFSEFRAFVLRLSLQSRYPGMLGIGFAQRVRGPDLSSFMRHVRLDGLSRAEVWPSGPRAEYYPVVLLEPTDPRSRATIGFDLGSDETLEPLLALARDSGEPVATGRLRFDQPLADGMQPSFVLIVPSYASDAHLETIADRRNALVGFVFSPFSAVPFFEHALPAGDTLAITVYGDAVPEDATRLHEELLNATPRYVERRPVRVAGRDWLIEVRAGRDWLIEVRGSRARIGPVYPFDAGTFIGGVALSLMLFLITAAQVRAWRMAIRHESELRDLAQHDALTGLPNRGLFGEHLTKAIALARRRGHHVAVLFLDLDRFKHINDSLGHAVGDLLLKSVAGRLTASVRESDTVSRHGGDEFVALLSGIEHADRGASRVQHVIDVVTAPHDVAGHHLQTTVSVGISMFPGDGEDAETLIRTADTAMYQAKERGRNTYQFYMPEMNARVTQRRWIETGLRRAVPREEFVLHYQPKIALDTGGITGGEALIRWVSPDRGIVSPTTFVPIAEDCGLIVPIGRWVLREACRQARVWIEEGRPVAVAVNISAIEFRDRSFLDHVRSILEETRLDPQFLELELTESVLMQNAESSVSMLYDLKDLGVKIALDDFGTGYSSLSYLRQFPIDVLKVDQSFVHEIAGPPHHGSSIVSAIISMGRSLHHRVIAEGIETREQVVFLQAQQCGEGQGFYFSRPLEASAFAQLL